MSKYIQLSTTIKETLWDEDAAQWQIQLEQGGEVKHDKADFLINASGIFEVSKIEHLGISAAKSSTANGNGPKLLVS